MTKIQSSQTWQGHNQKDLGLSYYRIFVAI